MYLLTDECQRVNDKQKLNGRNKRVFVGLNFFFKVTLTGQWLTNIIDLLFFQNSHYTIGVKKFKVTILQKFKSS